MATVVKVDIGVLNSKVASLLNSVQAIRREINKSAAIQKELATKHWAGDAAMYHMNEYNESMKEIIPLLISMQQKCQNLLKITVVYDKVEGYNIHAEAGMLPEDFIE